MCTIKRLIKQICRRLGLWDTVERIYVRRYEVVRADMALAGKNILVTGGTSGIGLAIAKKCLSIGANVVITGRSVDKLNDVLAGDKTGRLKVMKWDITDFYNLESHVNQVFGMMRGGIDVLVNNAGISIREVVGELTFDIWDRIFESNLKAPVFIAQAIVNKWIQSQRGGVILNISSMAGVEPAVDAYSSSKCALNSITKGMARRFGRFNIRINALAVGVTIGTNLRDLQRSVKPDGDVRADWIPIKRFAVPEEIAETAAFLISDQSSYTTGYVFEIDGAGAIRQ